MTQKHSENKSVKSSTNANKQSILRKDQEALLQYYEILSAKERKDALKFIKMIAGKSDHV